MLRDLSTFRYPRANLLMMLPPPRALLRLMRALLKTSLRRVFRRASQPLLYEAHVDVLRRQMAHAAELSLEAQRELFEQTAAPFKLPVERESGTLGGVNVEWFRPSTVEEGVVIYLHGGAYLFGSTHTHATLIGRIAMAARMTTLGVNYRLAPEHRVDDAIDDVVAVYRALLEVGTPPRLIAMVGDSAGGGLLFAALLRLRDMAWPMPAAAVGISPWIDHRAERPSYFENEETDWFKRSDVLEWSEVARCGDDISAAPYTIVGCDFQGLPRTLLHAGGGELFRDDVVAFTEKLDMYNVEARLVVWSGMCHSFHTLAGISALARDAIDDIGGFIRVAFQEVRIAEEKKRAQREEDDATS